MVRSGTRNWMWVLAVCLVHFLDEFNAQWVIEDDGCRTPDRGTGNCIPIDECKPMLAVVRRVKRPISDAVMKRLQAYTCGASESGIKVCCPPGAITLEVESQSQGVPPDVSNHPNLHLLPKDCGYLNTDNRITNGENAAFNEFPWMALLRYRSRKGLEFQCGGTIINQNYILTAAHCISGTTSPLVSVRVGEYSLKNDTDCDLVNKTLKCNSPVQDLNVEKVIPNSEFKRGANGHDIGLLRVSSMNLNFENVRPVCLPLGKERTKKYDAVFVTGWGVENVATGQTSDVLQKVLLPVANKSSCSSIYNENGIKLLDSQICAGGVSDKDSCKGDSGGPMMVPTVNEDYDAIYVQQGVVSFGPRFCGTPGYPGVYILVNRYMDWILNNLKP